MLIVSSSLLFHNAIIRSTTQQSILSWNIQTTLHVSQKGIPRFPITNSHEIFQLLYIFSFSLFFSLSVFLFFLSSYLARVPFYRKNDGDVCRPSAARLQKRILTIDQLHCCRHTSVTIFPNILAFRREPRGSQYHLLIYVGSRA